MKDKTLLIMCGCPGSGKSTWAKDYAAKTGAVIVSRDRIRFELLDKHQTDDYFKHEDEVWKLFIQTINDALDREPIVIADATHLNEKSRNKLMSALWNRQDVNFIPVFFDTPLETCIQRNEMREGRAVVPRSVIRRMYHQQTPPKYDELFDYDKIITITER